MSFHKRLLLAQPRGFCAGVRRALETVDRVLSKYGAPVFVLHEIVHNEYVVQSYKDKGVVFVESLNDVKTNHPVIFSAHGVSKAVEKTCCSSHLISIDATCPLVKRIHQDVISFRDKGFSVILIGHQNHPETMGTLGQAKDGVFVIEKIEDIDKLPIDKDEKVAFLTQTTLCQEQISGIIKQLEVKFKNIVGGTGICYATKNRQQVAREMSVLSDVVFIIGSDKSSNSKRLLEITSKLTAKSYLIGSVEEVKEEMFENAGTIGITAAASAPEVLVDGLIDFLQQYGWETPEVIGSIVENTVFPDVDV